MQKAQPARAVEVARQSATSHDDGRIILERPCAAANRLHDPCLYSALEQRIRAHLCNEETLLRISRPRQAIKKEQSALVAWKIDAVVTAGEHSGSTSRRNN